MTNKTKEPGNGNQPPKGPYDNDPIMQKLQQQIEDIQRKKKTQRKKLAEKDSKLLNSAKFSVIDFLLSHNDATNSLEGLKKVLNSVTHTNSIDDKMKWLELYEKFLKDERLREAFEFPKIQEDDSEQ